MDAEVLTQSVDKSQMPALHQKRILAFINHFLINSCSFLNDFALKCETKFIELERKMQKVEASLTIVEAKLASVPDVALPPTNNATAVVTSVKTTEDKPTTPAETQHEAISAMAEDIENTANNVDMSAEQEPTGVRACEDVRYKKFFKMVQFGVPAEAVKLKMQTEGVEPNILDTPNLLLDDGATQ